MSYHLVELIHSLNRPRVLVLGDVILDRYVWGDAERISQEAPVILLREDKQDERLGGAANVAQMIQGLDAQATMAGVTGADADAQTLTAHLIQTGADTSLLLNDSSRPTTVKVRYLGRAAGRHPHQMLRVDRETRRPIDSDLERELSAAVCAEVSSHDAVLISDYAKGVCTPKLVEEVIDTAKRAQVPVIVDPPGSGEMSNYHRATAATPNRLESSRAAGRAIQTVDDAFAAGRQLCDRYQLEMVFVTLDREGIALVRRDGGGELFPTRRREVYDITGAGDMVLAMIGVGMAAGWAAEDLARLANVAGGLEVEHIGVATISREDILSDLLTTQRVETHDKIAPLDEVARHLAARKKLGQRIVLTNGCFDLLHVGHVTYLQQAAAEGDCLVVAVNSDRSVRSLGKGPDRPLFDERQRTTMLAALAAVDYVVVFDESTPHQVIETLRPDLLVKGGSYRREEIVGWELLEQWGGEAKPLDLVPGVSTTDIVTQLRSPLRKAG